jgi:hypothetical protein
LKISISKRNVMLDKLFFTMAIQEGSMQKSTAFEKLTTPASIGAFGVMTWLFSAMQCNKEFCYTTDNPIAQVTFAGVTALAAIAVATSEPVVNKFNQASALLKSKFTRAAKEEKKDAQTNLLDSALISKPTIESPRHSPIENDRAETEIFSETLSPKAPANSTSSTPLNVPLESDHTNSSASMETPSPNPESPLSPISAATLFSLNKHSSTKTGASSRTATPKSTPDAEIEANNTLKN